jgi:hypothetical protein
MQRHYHHQTLHSLARSLRLSLITNLGEREFARQIMAFDRGVEGELTQVLALLLTTTEPATFQLALLWLDGKGRGRKLGWAELVELRRRVNRRSAKTTQEEVKNLLVVEASLLTIRITNYFTSTRQNQEVTTQACTPFAEIVNSNFDPAWPELKLVQSPEALAKDSHLIKRKPFKLLKLGYGGLLLAGLGGLGWLSLHLYSIGAPELAIPVLGLMVLSGFIMTGECL